MPHLLLSMDEKQTMDMLFIVVILMGVVLIAAVVFYFVNKRMKSSNEAEMQSDFTLEDLRKLQADGHMTPDEYNAAKAKVLDRTLLAEKRKEEARDRVKQNRPH